MLSVSASAANYLQLKVMSAFTWGSTTEAYYTVTSEEEEEEEEQSSWFGQYFKQV